MAGANAAIPRFLLPQLNLYPPIFPLAPHQKHHQNHNFPPFSPSSLLAYTPKLHFSSPASSVFTLPAPFLLNRCYNISNRKNNGDVFTIASQKSFFSAAPHWGRDHHFDTLKVVQRLKDEGFSEEQSRAMMLVLSDVIEESIQNLTRTMVLREDADRSTYSSKVDFTKLRSELLQADSNETTVTLASHERLSNDIAKLASRLRDEVGRAQASVKLDLNLEKGRIREEAKGQELKIRETETRIEQEVAGLRERVEGVKFSTLQWLM
ncbi:Coiled-coil domain-containing protein 90B, mitochondrial [Sticta canariensis]|nr:Coiled-coil domain-containing protein 90B, mitochondrial [Sticta canariensis]